MLRRMAVLCTALGLVPMLQAEVNVELVKGQNPWEALAGLLSVAVTVTILIAVYSGLLILINALAPKFTARCAKSITSYTIRNFLVGLVILIAWVIAARLASGCEVVKNSIILWGAVTIWSVKMFGGAAMVGLIGAKTLALRGIKKQNDEVKNMVTGMTVVMLGIATIIPGVIAFLILSTIELGATVCVRLGMK